MRSYLTTPAERLRAVLTIFLTCVVAALAAQLAVQAGWAAVAPLPPFAAGWLLARNYSGRR